MLSQVTRTGRRRGIPLRWTTQQYRALSDVYHPPSLINIPQRWRSLPQPLQREIQEYLDWQMTGDWNRMSREEMQSAYYVSYGSWGPRARYKGPIGRGAETTGSNQQINIPYLVIRALFNLALFSAVGVAMVNVKRDKKYMKSETE